MVRHVILWSLKQDMPPERRKSVCRDIKSALEGLCGKIDGLKKLSVRTEALPSSTADLMLDSLFESRAALEAYRANPLHVAAADGFVRPNVETRLCLDFEE